MLSSKVVFLYALHHGCLRRPRLRQRFRPQRARLHWRAEQAGWLECWGWLAISSCRAFPVMWSAAWSASSQWGGKACRAGQKVQACDSHTCPALLLSVAVGIFLAKRPALGFVLATPTYGRA